MIGLADRIAVIGGGWSLGTASARTTHGLLSETGTFWVLDSEGIAQLYATQHADFPFGELRFMPSGRFIVELGDAGEWSVYVALKGIEEGRPVRVTSWYAMGSTQAEERVDSANWNASVGAYTNLGPTSDGSLGANGAQARIIVEVTDGLEWSVTEAAVGWAQQPQNLP